MAVRESKYAELNNEAWLRDQYETQRLSCGEIAESLGCSRATVENRLHAFGVTLRGRYPEKWKNKTCTCGKEFTPSGPAQKFCTLECNPKARVCQLEECGKYYLPRPDQTAKGCKYPQVFCSMECRKIHWETNSLHRYKTSSGYIVIQGPTMTRRETVKGYIEINVGADNKNGGRVLEHIAIMEHLIGRKLLPHENVHHVNGQRDDNKTDGPLQNFRSGNLELWSTSQPSGQRVIDKVTWAREILREYAPEEIR